MSAFTRGPWRIEGLGGPQPLVFGNSERWGDRTWICTTTNDDARLIAAAPELYDAALETLTIVAKFVTERFGWAEADSWKVAATQQIDDPRWSADDRAYIRLAKAVAKAGGE